MSEFWTCAVSAAALWTDPDAPRPVDLAALDCPVQLDRWLSELSYEERLALGQNHCIQTQLLYGEQVAVEETIGDWAKVIAVSQPTEKNPRGYPGWVPLVQLSMREQLPSARSVTVTVPKAWLYEESGERFLQVSFHTVLPFGGKAGKRYRVWTPHGWKFIYANCIAEIKPSQLLAAAKQFTGLPYLWGGMSAWGYDCSGFVFNMMGACGIVLPRDAKDQAQKGAPVSLDERAWKRGDLLFFGERDSVHHVGIHAGNGKMLHAPSTGKAIEQIELRGSLYAEKLCAVRRVINEL